MLFNISNKSNNHILNKSNNNILNKNINKNVYNNVYSMYIIWKVVSIQSTLSSA